MSPWIQTFSGRRFWLDPISAADIAPEDVAHALSNLCRFGGHCLGFYSVAQHSVLVSRHCPPEHALWGLLHDAAEAYLVDVPRPIKPLLGGYRELEEELLYAVAERFALPWPMPDEVKRIDDAICLDERRCLLTLTHDVWEIDAEPLGIEIEPLAPEDARTLFVERFAELIRG